VPVSRNEYNARSTGGTELSIAEFEKYVEPEVLSKFQIIPSRFRGLQEGLIPIYWVHDTENDPEMHHLADGGWKKFAAIAFVSNWQMQRFVDLYGIPWSHCKVLPNAIEPVEPVTREWGGDRQVRFVYHTTPHRGLNVLYGAFQHIAEEYDVHLDVYSSFSIYGAPDRDAPFEPLFEHMRNNPKVTVHGAQPLPVVRDALRNADVFLYPSTWPETGCRALIEAMCHGLMCIHSNYGCLYETGAGETMTYQFHEDQRKHADVASAYARYFLKNRVQWNVAEAMKGVAQRSMYRYSWERRGPEWSQFLHSVLKGSSVR
jgi:UDP-glucose:(glucosyl)LPS alpha-1,2-glucosyltransferase